MTVHRMNRRVEGQICQHWREGGLCRMILVNWREHLNANRCRINSGMLPDGLSMVGYANCRLTNRLVSSNRVATWRI